MFEQDHVTHVSGIASDSLGASQIGRIAYETASEFGAQPINVDDSAIVAARKELWAHARIIAEHGAAASYAALTSGAYRPSPTETVCVIVCGANTDPSTL